MTKVIMKVKLSDLVEDFDIYPRHSVDSSYVSDLARAIEAGDTLPAVIIEKRSKRIVDGFHRSRAWKKVLGRGGEIEVEARTYKDEQALLKEAIELNARNGRKLDQQDRTRSAILLERHGIAIKEISVVLHTTEARVRELLNIRVVLVPTRQSGETGTKDAAPVEKRPAKPVAYPQRGEEPRTITPEQYRVMESSSGYRTAQTVTQLTRELEAGLVDLTISGIREKLWHLHDVIDATVPKQDAA